MEAPRQAEPSRQQPTARAHAVLVPSHLPHCTPTAANTMGTPMRAVQPCFGSHGMQPQANVPQPLSYTPQAASPNGWQSYSHGGHISAAAQTQCAPANFTGLYPGLTPQPRQQASCQGSNQVWPAWGVQPGLATAIAAPMQADPSVQLSQAVQPAYGFPQSLPPPIPPNPIPPNPIPPNPIPPNLIVSKRCSLPSPCNTPSYKPSYKIISVPKCKSSCKPNYNTNCCSEASVHPVCRARACRRWQTQVCSWPTVHGCQPHYSRYPVQC